MSEIFWRDADSQDDGFWFTTDTGIHIHIEPGESKEDAISRTFKERGIKSPKNSKIKELSPEEKFGSNKNTHDVSFNDAKSSYDKIKNTDFTFDPKNGKSYDAFNQSNAKELYNKFSDGKNDLYIIGTTNHHGDLDDSTKTAYEKSQSEKKYTLLGGWMDKSTNMHYKDVSFPINHGIDEQTAKNIKNNYKQISMLKINSKGEASIVE